MQETGRRDAGKADAALASAKDRAIRLLGARTRTSAEVRARLERDGFEPAVVDEVIAWLERCRYLDDASFAKEWVQARLRRNPAGREKLAAELLEKGVSSELAEEVLAALDPQTEYELAREAAAKRAASLAHLPRKRRESRLYGYLARRGFDAECARKAVDEVLGRGE